MGPVHQPGRRHWSTHPTSNHRSDRSCTDTNLLRPEQRAPPGVGVKDLRPLRGRPCGSIPDPDASPRRAHKQAENPQEKDQYKNYRLTGPAPSGMTNPVRESRFRTSTRTCSPYGRGAESPHCRTTTLVDRSSLGSVATPHSHMHQDQSSASEVKIKTTTSD